MSRGRDELVTRQTVRRRLLNFEGDSVEWPDDYRFKRAWVDDPVYLRVPQNILKVVFSRIVESRQGNYNEPVQVEFERMTLEHLMPQAWQNSWQAPSEGGTYRGELESPDQRRDRIVQTIGNLTLLGQSLNSAVSNGDWKPKREQIAAHGMFPLNADFITAEQWNEATIVARSESLWQEAKVLWPYPGNQDSKTKVEASMPTQVGLPVSPVGPVPPVIPATISKATTPSPAGSEQTNLATAQADHNPFRVNSTYWAIVESLKQLGEGQMFAMPQIVETVRRLLGEEWWKNYSAKPGNAASTRIATNVYTLTRSDYGSGLRNFGFEVRFNTSNDTAGLFKLAASPGTAAQA